jgi:hypothetical protein
VPLNREGGKHRLHKHVRAAQQGHMESMAFKDRRKRGTRVAHGEHGVGPADWGGW